MISRKLKPTKVQIAWLKRLRDEGPAKNGGRTGHWSRAHKFSEWYVTLSDGRQLPISELYAEYSGREHLVYENVIDQFAHIECITEAGRDLLSALTKENAHGK